MKVSSPRVSMSGTTPIAVDISDLLPTLAPMSRNHVGANTVA